MAIQNKVSAVLEDTALTGILTSVSSIGSQLPFLIDLAPDEKKQLPKFGDRSVAFVEKALELVKLNEDFLPRSFDVEEFRKDVDLYKKLYSILLPLKMLLEKVEDTSFLVGSEAYSAALVVYSNAKLARGELAGLETILDDLSIRFLSKSSPAETEIAETP